MFGTWYKRSWKETFNGFFKMIGISLLVYICIVCVNALPVVTIPLVVIMQLNLNYSFYLKVSKGKVFIDNVFLQNEAFSSFDGFFRIFGGAMWKWLWLFLWGLIPVFGVFMVIYKRYEYFIAEFLLYRCPKIRANDILEISKEMTKGYKKSMFAMDIVLTIMLTALCILVSFGFEISDICGIVAILIFCVLFTILLLFYSTYRAVCFDSIFKDKVSVVKNYYEKHNLLKAKPKAAVEEEPIKKETGGVFDDFHNEKKESTKKENTDVFDDFFNEPTRPSDEEKEKC